VPFDNKGVGDLLLWNKIIDRIYEFSPRLLSFSGGDPFAYPNFYDLLLGMDKRCFINVDTSGLYLNSARYANIAKKIDAIGISMDDVDNMINRQRFSQKQCKKVLQNMQILAYYQKQITVHTLLTPLNQEYLCDIAKILISYGIKAWNVYQFWPFSFIHNKQKYFLSDSLFFETREKVNSLFGSLIDIKFKLYTHRATGYFFVTSIGNVYTVNPNNINEYIFIDSIFNSSIYEKWRGVCDLTDYDERLNKRLSRNF
jgi:MoaA/NifB/PqqE/SkfB family radical SAM enzyme